MNAEQQAEVIDLVSEQPWDDIDAAIRDMETALRLALAATGEAFLIWEERADNAGFQDEFSLTPDQLEDLSLEWRLAYIARLLRSLALSYGISAEFGGGRLVGEERSATPAAILRRLNDISWTQTTTQGDKGE